MKKLHKGFNKKISKTIFVTMVAGTLISSPFLNAQVYADSEKEKEVLVVYKNEKGKVLADKKGDVLYEFETIPALSVELKEKDIKELEKNPNILYVEENVEFKIAGSPKVQSVNSALITSSEISWNIGVVQAADAWEDGVTGKGVKVAILDTGVTPHADLKVKDGVSTVDYTSSFHDDNGHGTHVAGIVSAEKNGFGVVGVAPDADIYAVKVMDANGNGTLLDILEGLDWCIQNNMDIVNMSIATPVESLALKSMIQQMYNRGMLLVSSAGNVGTPDGSQDTVLYPAKWNEVIAVGAVDTQENRASFSATGSALEFVAPGVSISSTGKNGTSFTVLSGTSQAAPHVTGLLALLKEQNPTLSTQQLRNMLSNQSKDLGEKGRDTWYGWGLAQYKKAVKINPLLLDQIELTLSLAERYKLNSYVNRAKNLIDSLPESSEKQAFLVRLQKLLPQELVQVQPLPVRTPSQIELNNAELALKIAERYKLSVYVDRAKRLIEALPECEQKQSMLERLQVISN